ncbi:MAG: methyl-accepting chemotaxis protein [Gemmatimonadales bacterium]
MPPTKRSSLSRAMQLGGAVGTVVLTAVVWVFLSGDLRWPLGAMLGAFALLCLLILWVSLSWLNRRVIEPLRAVSAITLRIADFDLAIGPAEVGRIGGGPVTDAMERMVRELNRLVGSIRRAAADSASLAAEISAATEHMAASTGEVATTTAALTRRAVSQAGLVRAVAEDATRILAIAGDLASGALQAVERNAALVQLARGHRERLGASVKALDQLAEEVRLGTAEAEALEEASEALERFVEQGRTVAQQTRILALNASIEAARSSAGSGSGAAGNGFGTVAEQVRKLSGQAALAATATSETVQVIAGRVSSARDRLLRLGQGGLLARETALAASEGLQAVAAAAEDVDQWSRRVSQAAEEMRSLLEGIVERTRTLAAGTEEFATAAQQIAAATEAVNLSTEGVTASAQHLAGSAQRLTQAAGNFRTLD